MAPQVKTIAAIRPEGLIGGIIREGFGDGLKKHSFFSLSPNRMSNYLALRSSAAPTFTVSTLLAKSISIQSTTISLGQSTNQSYTNFSNGSFTTGWASTLTGLTSIKDVVLSPNGSVQTILQNSGSTMSTVITSLNSGQTWTGSTMRGLPTSGALPYQTYGSTINTMPVPSITAITAAPSSGNQLAIASNELVYASANSGATFAATGLGQNNSPFIYMPFDGSSVADVMGNATVTTTGSMAYVPGKVGTNALNLTNTAGGTAANYIDLITAPLSSFTAAGWFNIQAFSATQRQWIFSGNGSALSFSVDPTGVCYYTSLGVSITTSFTISTNTWYQFTVIFQSAGLCSLYINGRLIGQATGTAVTTGANMRLGAISDFTIHGAFNGYIDDFRLYNYAVTNPSGAALINPLVGPIMPYVYLTFDGSTTTDLMGNSTTTATGSPGFVAGQVGSNALDLSTNTAGGTAGKYIRGTWTGSSVFTVSVWFNSSSPTSSGNQSVLTAYSTLFQISLNPSGVLYINVPTGATSVLAGASSSAIAANTWYNVIVAYQSGVSCYVYLNGTQIVFYNTLTANSSSTTQFNIGSLDSNTTQAFRGYIDDFRIYNGAFLPSQLSPVLYSPSYAVGSPNIYLPFENGSVLDTMGYSAISARGTMNFVPGVVGTSALNLVNPSGGTATNFLYGSWSGSPNFTISGWFNTQALAPGGYQVIFCSYNFGLVLYINPSNQLALTIPSGGAGLGLTVGPTSYTITPNTWYHFIVIFQTNGLCSLYVNNALVGSATNTSGVGTFTVSQFALGRYDVVATSTNAFNGYIDDLKIYNCAVPFSALGPMNYTQAAISNSGAYQVVAAANGGVYTSANSGSTWSQALTSPAVASAVNTVGGQLITPNLTGLAAATWTQNGVNWVASASTTLSGGIYDAYRMFNNTYDSNSRWVPSSNSYTTTGNSSGISNTILGGVGSQTGDWLQIQSSVPLVMSSYQFASSGINARLPKIYYITGSNDGSNWYPLQYVSGGAVTTTTINSLIPGVILVNSTSTQTFGTSTVATTAYSTSTNAYTYFRLVILASYSSSADFIDIGEWVVNFATPATPLYVAPSAALIANQSLNAITVMPQQTGLLGNTTSSTPVTTTWTTANGVSWTASASSVNSAGFQPWVAFNNIAALTGVIPYSWATPTSYNTSGFYTGSVTTTVLGGVGTVSGEWLQIQSSVPLIMSSYTYAVADYRHTPKTGYIVGSNDGTTWYPIQNISMTTNPLIANWTSFANYIVVNQNGIQTIQGGQTGSGTFTSYPTTTNAYTYFRVIGTSVWPNQYGNLEFTEWFINFTAYTPALLQSLSMSPSGQYMALTGAGATAPNSTAAVAATWAANGVSWTSSISSQLGGTPYPYFPFQNTNGGNIWISLGNYSSGVYNNTYSTTVLGGIGTVNGEWLQIQSSVPLVITSYTFQVFNAGNLPKSYYIVGSSDGTTWYPIQLCVLATNPITSTNVKCSNDLLVNFNGIQTLIGNVSSAVTTTAYTSTTTNAYTYFRIIVTSLFSTGTNAEIGEWYINFQSGPTFYSTDYGSSWTRSLTAATIPNANVLATSGNGQYSLQACGQTVFIAINTSVGNPTGNYTTPTFSPALSNTTGPVSNAAISATGQYMVVLIQSTSNNVYYSSNYGVSFTGITLGSTAMVSCAVSADGSYITVASATQVFTLNSNTQGLSITVGNQSGLTNQGQNAVAIGNQAGQINQSANSIVLNSSGTAVNAYAPGFFVAPVASAGSSVSSSFAVLGYGTDNQVVQTGVSIRADGTFTGTASFAGNVGIGTTAPAAPLHLYTSGLVAWPFLLNYLSGLQLVVGNGGTSSIIFDTYNAVTGTRPPLCLNTSGGFVGIGTAAPATALHVVGSNSIGTPAVVSFVNNGGGQNGTGSDIVNSQITMGLYGPYIRAVQRNSFYTDGIRLDLCTNLGSNDSTPVPRISILSGLQSGYVGIGTTAPGATLDVVGTVRGSIFTTQNTGVYAGNSTNTFTLIVPYPATYLFTVTGNGAYVGGGGDNYAKAIIYIHIGSTGVLLTTVVQAQGVAINSYTPGTQTLSYNIGTGGLPLQFGGNSNVSIIRLG